VNRVYTYQNQCTTVNSNVVIDKRRTVVQVAYLYIVKVAACHN